MSTLLVDERGEAPALRFGFLLPALGALLYPFLLTAISFGLANAHVTVPPAPLVIAISVAAILAVAVAVLSRAVTQALAVARAEPTNSSARFLAIIAHLACGLRGVMLEHGVSDIVASRTARVLIGLGIAVSTTILAGLLGAHIA